MEAAGATRRPWACPEGRGPGAARHEGGGGRLEDGCSARPPQPPAALTFSSARCRSCLLAFSTSEEGPLMTTVSLPEPSTGKWMWTPPHSSMMARIRRPFVPMRELCSLAGIETSASVMLAWNHTRHEGATFACGRDGRAHRARGLGQAGTRAAQDGGRGLRPRPVLRAFAPCGAGSRGPSEGAGQPLPLKPCAPRLRL